MLTRLRRHLAVATADGEAAFLLCEHGAGVLAGPLGPRLLRTLDGGGRPRALDGVDPATITAALRELRAAGHVVDVDPEVDERTAGYWDAAGLDGDAAVAACAAPVRARALGAVGDAVEALRRTGIEVAGSEPAAGDGVGLDVVLVDDYLNPGLPEIARELAAAGRVWLLARPVGIRLHVGPVFVAGGPCYFCLRTRLRENRPVETYLADGAAGQVRVPVVDLPQVRAWGIAAVGTAITHWLAGHRSGATHAVTTIDTLTFETSVHPVHKRPQCGGCGDPRLGTAAMAAPVRLEPRPKAPVEDGGHRAAPPERMLAEFGRFVDPVTGIVPELRAVRTDLPDLHVYTSGANRALRGRSLAGLRGGLRTTSGGKGAGDLQARASALGEAVERHCGAFAGDEPRRTERYRDLRADAVHPNEILHYSERQYAQRKRWTDMHTVGVPFDESAPVDWTPVWSLTRQCHRFLPSALLFFDYPVTHAPFGFADSNGNAAGTSLEDAILQGAYELVERDAVAIWWYNRLRVPGIDLDALDDPWAAAQRARYAVQGREMWALDLTQDLGIPVVAAVSRRVAGATEDILFGLGAHADARIALRRAIAEMNQFLAHAFTPDGYAPAGPAVRHWLAHARLAGQPHLAPDPGVPRRPLAARPEPTTDLRDDVDRVRRSVERAGLEMFVLDLTRPDIGMPVVKVIVPGLRHFWARFAPGRLYDVPVRSGTLGAALPEADLNPIPFFL